MFPRCCGVCLLILHPLNLRQPSATLHIKHLCWSHQKIMRSPDSYDTGRVGGVYLVWGTWHCINGHQWQIPANTTTHTHARDKRWSSDKWTETVCKYIPIPLLLLDVETVFLITYCPVLSRWHLAGFQQFLLMVLSSSHLPSHISSPARQFKHPPFSIMLYNFLHKTPQNGPWWSVCGDESIRVWVTNVHDVATVPARFVGC